MTKNDLYIFIFIGLIILVIIFNLLNQNMSSKFIKKLDIQEQEKRKEILLELEKIKIEREELRKEMEALKIKITEHEKTLLTNIQTIKLKANVQIRNLNDSTNAALLKDLLPK